MKDLGWADSLIICGLLLIVYALGRIQGSRERRKNKRIPWHRNAHDMRDRQGHFNRIWRVR